VLLENLQIQFIVSLSFVAVKGCPDGCRLSRG